MRVNPYTTHSIDARATQTRLSQGFCQKRLFSEWTHSLDLWECQGFSASPCAFALSLQADLGNIVRLIKRRNDDVPR